jgi:hypothetical protein
MPPLHGGDTSGNLVRATKVPCSCWYMDERPKTSIIWTMPKDQFVALVKASSTICGVCNLLGLRVTGDAHRKIQARIRSDCPELLSELVVQGKKYVTPLPLEQILVEGSTYNRCHLKARLIKGGTLKNECAICGQKPEWNGKPLVMVLDHANGVHNDNRPKNLRLLCPNCASQQPTFSGRNRRYRIGVSSLPSQGRDAGALPATATILT